MFRHSPVFARTWAYPILPSLTFLWCPEWYKLVIIRGEHCSNWGFGDGGGVFLSVLAFPLRCVSCQIHVNHFVWCACRCHSKWKKVLELCSKCHRDPHSVFDLPAWISKSPYLPHLTEHHEPGFAWILTKMGDLPAEYYYTWKFEHQTKNQGHTNVVITSPSFDIKIVDL